MSYFEPLMENSKSVENFKQGFHTGDFLYRLGNPFIWVDASVTQSVESCRYLGKMSVLSYLSMYYEYYATPQDLCYKDPAPLREALTQRFSKFFTSYFPHLNIQDYSQFLKCIVETDLQEYLVMGPFLDGIKSPKVMDFGPGLGRHAVWVKSLLKEATYIGVDISPLSYQVQNEFLPSLGPVKDYLLMEQFGTNPNEVRTGNDEIWHLPTWHLPKLKDEVDCVVATFMLNETTTTGCLYLLQQAVRTIKEGGFFYLRDSNMLKPSRHSIDYDKILMEMGFQCVVKHNYKNRVDFFGIPRVYKRVKPTRDGSLPFYEFCQKYVGKFDITNQPGHMASRLNK